MKRFLGMALAAALAIPGWTVAQSPLASVIGDTVRVTAPAAGREKIRGVLVAVRDDSLFLRRYGRTFSVPIGQVEWVEVRRRRPRIDGLLRGVLYGAPIGLGSGYLTGTLLEGGGDDCGDDCGLLPVMFGAMGLAAGTVFGGLFGVTEPGGRWEDVSARPVMVIEPARGGVALSLTAKL